MAVDSQLPLALWVVPVAEFGGVARHVYDVAAAGLPGFRLAILLPEGELSRRLGSLARVLTADFGTEAGFAASFSTLKRVISELRPAVVHSHLAYADTVAAAVVTALRVGHRLNPGVHLPLLASTEHGIAGVSGIYHGSELKAQGRKLLHRLRLRVTDRAIAVSASTAEQMRKNWGARRVEIIRNGVDSQRIASLVHRDRVPAHGGPRILSLSRLAPEKGLPLLLEAFARVRETYPQAHLELAGSGPLLRELREQAAGLGLDDSVSFPGFVDPLEAMGRNDFVVQLSLWENLSYTLLDAKAVPLRVVATDVGGNREIVADRELVAAAAGKAGARDVARRIVQLWEQPVAPGKPIPSVEHMVREIVACYGRGMR